MTVPQPANDAGAQVELEQAILRAGLTNDPLGPVLRALGGAIGELHAVAEQARRPDDERARRAMVAEVAQATAGRIGRRTALIAMALVAVLMLCSAALGWAIANRQSTQFVASTEAGVSAAFRDGAPAAGMWLNLMRANSADEVMASCARSTVNVAGRRACAVGLWLDAPANTAPVTLPAR